MAKRKRKTNEKTIRKWQREGRGTGNLEKYKPWLTIQDVPSKGLATRIQGTKTGRIHHLLSQLELNCFYCLEWSEKIIDIREQYPLYILETLALANEFNIKHPKIHKTNEVIVMTTDFLVTVSTPFGMREIAINVKYSKDLANRRTIEKLELERIYWERRGIEWRILTEKQINFNLVRNIKWLHSFMNKSIETLNINSTVICEISLFLSDLIRDKKTPLRNITNLSDKVFSLEPGTSLLIARYLLANRFWIVEMQYVIYPEKPLLIINQNFKGGF